MLDLFVPRQQFGKIEGGSDLADPRTCRTRTRNVVKQVVQQVVDGVLVESVDALVDHALDLPVGLSEQALQRDGCLQPAILQGFQNATRNPPKLVHVVAWRGVFQRCDDFGKRVEMVAGVSTLDPPQQRKLEFGSQPGRDCDRVFATHVTTGRRLRTSAR